MIPETIDTDRIRLRMFRDADTDDLMAGCDDPLIRRHLPKLPAPYTERDARWWITEGAPAAWAAGGAAYAVADPETDRLLGTVGLSNPVPDREQAELGYWLASWARGRGLAAEAATALAGHAFRSGFGRLELLTRWENSASQRVALAAGFGYEGVRRGGGAGADGSRYDLLVWSRLATDPAGPAARLLPDLPEGRLTDGVVTLRPLRPEDADFIHDLHTQPDVVATSVPPVAPPRAASESRCARSAGRWLVGERAELLILDAASGAPAGNIALVYRHPEIKQGMFGYSMHPAFRGRGYPVRAVRLLAGWAFEHAGLARIEAGTVPENAASQRVLLKAGFQREGHQRGLLPGADGTHSDNVLFGLLPTDLAGDPGR